MSILDKINTIRKQFEHDIISVKKTGDFDALYLKYFSKTNGQITLLMKEIPKLSRNEKIKIGPLINSLQRDIKKTLEKVKEEFNKETITKASLDLTLPETAAKSGFIDPTNQIIREMNKFFRYYGFSVYDDREIENLEYNFRKLNLPEGHPATDLQDTLFIKQPNILLRTHTSSVEARILSKYKPPIRAVIPGKCYRNETANRTNNSFFYQYQGVVVDKDITIQHLKATLELFHKALFGENITLRFRYKYYPEVSPGMGTDILCPFCKGKGCEVCKLRGWIEVLGSGMIHYNTLKMCGIDPEIYTGFAFGMGLDRFVMSKFGISDIRKLYGGGKIYL